MCAAPSYTCARPDSVTDAGALATPNERATSAAGCQFASPAWEAVTVTSPAPVNVSTLPFRIAGPAATEKATGRPLDAVADSSTTSGTRPSFNAANSIVWPARATVKTPVTAPNQPGSVTVAATSYVPACTGAAADPL